MTLQDFNGVGNTKSCVIFKVKLLVQKSLTRKEGPEQELTLPSKSSFFCYQVFFDNDPSSSTSLLSSVSSDHENVSKEIVEALVQ